MINDKYNYGTLIRYPGNNKTFINERMAYRVCVNYLYLVNILKPLS